MFTNSHYLWHMRTARCMILQLFLSYRKRAAEMCPSNAAWVLYKKKSSIDILIMRRRSSHWVSHKYSFSITSSYIGSPWNYAPCDDAYSYPWASVMLTSFFTHAQTPIIGTHIQNGSKAVHRDRALITPKKCGNFCSFQFNWWGEPNRMSNVYLIFHCNVIIF